jgi:hypothetical protein
MLNLVSLIIGAIALLLAIPAFIPLLGWLNWLVVPMALAGLGIGFASGRSAGRNLNLVVVAVGGLRLMLGGGIL